MSIRPRLFLALCIGVGGLLGCESLPLRDVDQCGNAVVERGEDCDLFAPSGTYCSPSTSVLPCRYLCGVVLPTTSSNQNVSTCPAGYGCGLDGVCRTASGEYEFVKRAIDIPHELIDSADIDGDQISDLLVMTDYDTVGRRNATIYFSEPGEHETLESYGLDVQTSQCHLFDINGDGLSDLVFSHGQGFATMLGQSSRIPQSVAYPTAVFPDGIYGRMFALDVDSARMGDEFLGILFLGKKAILGDFGVSTSLSDIHLFFELGDLNRDEIVFPPTMVQLTDTGCPSVVFMSPSLGQLRLWHPCIVGENGTMEVNDQTAPIVLPLPPDVSDMAPVASDLDGDAVEDLVLPGKEKLWFLPGDLSGLVATTTDGTVEWKSVDYPAELEGNIPVLVADINRDSKLDFLSQSGLIVSAKKTGQYSKALPWEGTPWANATVADVTGNQRQDIILAAKDSNVVEMYLQSNTGMFTVARYLMRGPVKQMVIGDFDGDDISDIAFVTTPTTESETDPSSAPGEKTGGALNAVEVMFGQPLRSPSAPVTVADLPNITDVVSGKLPYTPNEGQGDNAGDLLVGFGGEVRQLSLIEGSSSRTLLAPLVIRNGVVSARIVAVAPVQLDSGAIDFVALGVDPDGSVRMWALSGIATDNAGQISSAPLSSKALAGSAYLGDEVGAVIAVGEFLPGKGQQVVAAFSLARGSNKSGIVVGRILDGQWVVSEMTTIDGNLSLDACIHIVAINDSGEKYVALSTGAAEQPGQILLFQADRERDALNYIGQTTIEGGVSSFTTKRNFTFGSDLFAINANGVFHVTLDAENHLSHSRVSGLPGGLALTSGDYGGDGLDDFAIGDGHSLRVFRMLPVLE